MHQGNTNQDTTRYYYTCIRMAKVEKTENIKCRQEREQLELMHTADTTLQNSTTTLENHLTKIFIVTQSVRFLI